MGGRGQADNEEAGRGVTESGHAPAPVGLAGEGGPGGGRHLLAPSDEAGTQPAIRHFFLYGVQELGPGPV
jgi:hypothetical protein